MRSCLLSEMTAKNVLDPTLKWFIWERIALVDVAAEVVGIEISPVTMIVFSFSWSILLSCLSRVSEPLLMMKGTF